MIELPLVNSHYLLRLPVEPNCYDGSDWLRKISLQGFRPHERLARSSISVLFGDFVWLGLMTFGASKFFANSRPHFFPSNLILVNAYSISMRAARIGSSLRTRTDRAGDDLATAQYISEGWLDLEWPAAQKLGLRKN